MRLSAVVYFLMPALACVASAILAQGAISTGLALLFLAIFVCWMAQVCPSAVFLCSSIRIMAMLRSTTMLNVWKKSETFLLKRFACSGTYAAVDCGSSRSLTQHSAILERDLGVNGKAQVS